MVAAMMLKLSEKLSYKIILIVGKFQRHCIFVTESIIKKLTGDGRFGPPVEIGLIRVRKTYLYRNFAHLLPLTKAKDLPTI